MTRAARRSQAGWLLLLAICVAAFVALTFRVNAVKSEVRAAERQIVALERQKLLLETEVQSRASQRQLAAWNAVEFGYAAPRGDQFVDHQWQLASLGAPPARGAPQPLRYAQAEPKVERGELSRALDDLPIEESRDGLRTAAALLDMTAASGEAEGRAAGIAHTLNPARGLGQALSATGE